MSERQGDTMPDGEHPIESYLSQLARRLHLPAAERDQVLAEVRGHLEERARALHETGVSEEHAERQAVLAFGPVGRISRELRASHPTAWGKRRWIVGMVTSAGVTWALWVVATVPVLSFHFYTSVLSGWPPIPNLVFNSLLASLAFGFGVFQPNFWPGGLVWLWALPFFVLYLVLPFRWGGRAQHWWVPGLAYGLGAALPPAFLGLLLSTVRLMNLPRYSPMERSSDVGVFIPGVISPWVWFIAVTLCLALAASFVGWLWRQRSASVLGRAQAA